ncbi:MAG: hypothetical protein AVDCRST_MAG19-3845, partial [uncultured Thermomicrobiales bacterium]
CMLRPDRPQIRVHRPCRRRSRPPSRRAAIHQPRSGTSSRPTRPGHVRKPD